MFTKPNGKSRGPLWAETPGMTSRARESALPGKLLPLPQSGGWGPGYLHWWLGLRTSSYSSDPESGNYDQDIVAATRWCNHLSIFAKLETSLDYCCKNISYLHDLPASSNTVAFGPLLPSKSHLSISNWLQGSLRNIILSFSASSV